MAGNARQLANIINKTYPTLATSTQTKLISCQDRKSTDETLNCIEGEITKIIRSPSYGENAKEMQALTNVSLD